MVEPILVILICLVSAYVFSQLFKLFGMPRVVGHITAGLIIGYFLIYFPIFTQSDKSILAFLANLGIILLFYYVGLETNFKTFAKNINRSCAVSLFNTLLPFISGFLIMRYVLGLDILPSLIIGVCLSVSAQSVSVDILEELKMLRSKLGSMIISIGAVDDVIELVMVTMILSAFHFMGDQFNMSQLSLDLVLFSCLIIIARLWLIPLALKVFEREKSSTSRFTASLIIVLFISSLSEFLGIGTLVGAMVAGIIVRQIIFKDLSMPNWEEHDIARSIHIISFGFLIPLFFVWIGMSTQVQLIPENIWLILLFFMIATLGTVLGTAFAIMLGKGKFSEGVIIGWGLNPKGDIELVIASLALGYGVITQQIFTSLVVMSLLTAIISPVVFKALAAKYKVKKSNLAT